MYLDPSYKRLRDYLDVNEHEMARAKQAAALIGMQYGVFKRYALNKVTQEFLAASAQQINAEVCDV